MSRQALYLRETTAAICKVRESSEHMLLEQYGYAMGMAAAGLFLGARPDGQYARLWDLAHNAYQYRRAELRAEQHPFGRTYLAPQQEAA